MMARLILIPVVVVLLGFAPAPFPRPERKKKVADTEAIQGTWKVVLYEMRGGKLGGNLVVKVEKDRWHFYRDGGGGALQPASSYQLRLDPAATPPAFDWSGVGAPNPGYIGSYRLEEKRLTIIFGAAGRPRPTDFNAGAEYRMVLERR
jgi:uncharacterized protein (TIGR03067 family)